MTVVTRVIHLVHNVLHEGNVIGPGSELELPVDAAQALLDDRVAEPTAAKAAKRLSE